MAQTADNPLADNRAQYYVPYTRSVRSIRNAALQCIEDLSTDGRADLSAPFARILEALAGVDNAALAALDEAYAKKHKGQL